MGCYLLRLDLPQAVQIAVGKAGVRQFLPGSYLYVGSAFGPGGVRARLDHHLRHSERPHWHIDYLRHYAAIDEIWYSESEQRLEHRWARAVSRMSASQPVSPGLGASDCGCPTHLFYFSTAPTLAGFKRNLRLVSTEELGEGIDYLLQRTIIQDCQP
ncbi:MAG: GIY-YIG nuclease family protein [Gammaproteobacteria bacterium]